MPTDAEMLLVRLEDIAWSRAVRIQVKRHDVGRRMEVVGGPIKSLPLLGTVRRYAIEVVYKDETWDRTHWLDCPIQWHQAASEMAAEHELPVVVLT